MRRVCKSNMYTSGKKMIPRERKIRKNIEWNIFYSKRVIVCEKINFKDLCQVYLTLANSRRDRNKIINEGGCLVYENE